MIDHPPFLPFSKPVVAATRLRLHYLDGMRGLAAVAVVLGHAQLQSGWHGGSSAWSHVQILLIRAVTNGRAAVAVFIVLSGYCLMIPVARSVEGVLRGGVLSYFKRRARRILPPYYCALALILLTTSLTPASGLDSVAQWRDAYPLFTPSAIISHLFLIHNWKPGWIFKIDPPAWTVATEWQIYFFFPALLHSWRKFGSGWTVFIAFCIGLIPYFVSHHGEGASPWFLGLFTLGMAAASINFSERYKTLQSRLPWGWFISCIAAVALLLDNLYIVPPFNRSVHDALDNSPHCFWLINSMVGLATACLLVFCTRSVGERPQSARPFILWLLERPAFVFVGSFSYSIYLIHDPILAYLCVHSQSQGLSHAQTFAAVALLGLPASVVMAYLFHLAFEKRFMSKSKGVA